MVRLSFAFDAIFFFNMENVYSKIALLYSFEQKCFHIETVREYIKSNITATLKKQDHEYRLVAILNNRDDCDKFIAVFSKKINIQP